MYSPSSGLLLCREEHNAGRACERELRDGCQDERDLEAEAPVLPQVDELPPATGAWDAWGGAHRGATGEQGPLALAGVGAGKLAVREQAVRAQDASRPLLLQELRLALPAAPAWAALCIPDVVRSGAQSFAAREVVPRRVRTEQRDAARPLALAAPRTQNSLGLSMHETRFSVTPLQDVRRRAMPRLEKKPQDAPPALSLWAVAALQVSELATERAVSRAG